MNILLVLFLSFSSFASGNIDQKLSSYIKKFNLTPVSAPKTIRPKLFSLGRLLFHDETLSGNQNIRCADCHHPRLGTQEGIPLSLGEGAFGLEIGLGHRMQMNGRVLARNSPALMNLHNVNVLFWDGRVSFDPTTSEFKTPVKLSPEITSKLTNALAAQAIFPLVDHNEMRGQKGSNPIADAKSEYEAWALIVQRVMDRPEYRDAFYEIYQVESINIGHIGEALGEFQAHAFYIADTPYDRYLKGNIEALTPEQKVGMDVFFNKAKCGQCHHGEHLTDLDFSSVGVPQIGPGIIHGDDFGRYQWDNDESRRYAFRVPPLRNVSVTAPYFHNGAFKTLEEVVEHYDDIQASLESYNVMERLTDQLNNYLSPVKDHDHSTNLLRLSLLPEDLNLKLHLSNIEEKALVEFLKVGLTDYRLQD